MMEFINISAYKFVCLAAAELPVLRQQLKEKADALQLKGTILLSQEGINCFLSGVRQHINDYKSFLESCSLFSGMTYKESVSHYQPFSRMLVRLKKEIISMGHPEVEPEKKAAPYISPERLKRWYEEYKDMIVLDTRNDYEVEIGTFENAMDLNIETFRDFPNAVALLPDCIKKKPIVTFCTGGIRCEKAAQYMLNQGFEEVYQLDGGVLNYFEKCGGDHWNGECFVFDKRVAIDPQLRETNTKQCYECRGVLTPDRQNKPCPECGGEGHLRRNE